jgi:hypothetical protein
MIICKHCGIDLFWSPELRVWVARHSLMFWPKHTHEPKEN